MPASLPIETSSRTAEPQLIGRTISPATSRRKRTVTLTIRLDEHTEEALREEAANRNITVNGLVNRIVRKYVEWDSQAEKFDAVTIPAENLAQQLNLIDDEALAEAARELAEYQRSLISIWYKVVTPETVLKFLIFYYEHANMMKIAFSKDEPQRITGFHHLGRKGSILFKHFIEALFQLAGKKIIADAQENHFSFVIDTRRVPGQV